MKDKDARNDIERLTARIRNLEFGGTREIRGMASDAIQVAGTGAIHAPVGGEHARSERVRDAERERDLMIGRNEIARYDLRRMERERDEAQSAARASNPLSSAHLDCAKRQISELLKSAEKSKAKLADANRMLRLLVPSFDV